MKNEKNPIKIINRTLNILITVVSLTTIILIVSLILK